MKKNWLMALALGSVSAIVYFASLADYVYPGESASLIACWRGLEHVTSVQYPLMSVFARLFGGGNLIAPICGLVAVVALFHLVATFVAWRVRREDLQGRREEVAAVAAVTAAIVFMLTPSVRSAATHLEPRLFDFAWALLSFALVIPFFRAKGGKVWLYALLLGVMAGLGLVDSALFVAVLPFYLVLISLLAVEKGGKPYVPLFLFGLFAILTVVTALGVFGLDAGEFLQRTAAELRLYRTIPGWIFILIFATVPFVTALFASGKAYSERPTLVQWVFHIAMTFVAVLAICTPFSPSALMEPCGFLPIATSAFAAALAGYLVAYWWINRKMIVGLVVGGLFAFVLAVTVVVNLFAFEGRRGAFADQVARKIVDDLDGRKWIVTDGLLDNHLKIVAAECGKDVKIISLARDLDESYLADLGELIAKEGVGGSKNGALRLSLSLGVLPFVQDWFSSDPSVVKDVVIFGAPDLWHSAGLKPVPEFFFFGADSARKPDWSAWKEFDKVLEAPKGWGSYHDRKVSNPVDRMRFSLRRHLGFVANNRGVYLQDEKKDDEAFAMYELVLNEIDHDNICAIFNEVAMVGQNHRLAKAKKNELERMLKTAVEDKNRRYLLWRLGTYYGYIRSPDVFVRLGYGWARSGRPGDALGQIRRAIDFVPTDKKTVLLNMMAALYASENDQRKSKQIYESVLARNGNDHDALIGMMRLELLDGNNAKALEYLQRAARSSGEGNRAKIELAMVHMMKGELPQAKELYKAVLAAEPGNMQAWSLLAAVTMQQIDATKDKKAQAALLKELEGSIVPGMEKQTHNQFDYYLQSTKGFLYLRQGEEGRRKARESFLLAARSRPDIASAQDLVLGLDISLDDKAGAETHAKEALRRNRNAPLANYVMGSLALSRGKYVEAEAFLRRAADAPQPVPLALNDLAEVLRRNKNLTEAERYARLAVKNAPDLYVAWETLGSILMDANHGLDEAEAAIRKACQLSKDKNGREADVRMLISLARVQFKGGDKQHAKVTIRKIRSRLDELSDFEKREFEDFMKNVQ